MNPRGHIATLTAMGAGRKPGTLNRATREIRQAARRLVEDAKYCDSLQWRLREGKAPHMEVLLFHYAYGKPTETVRVEGAQVVPIQILMLTGGREEETHALESAVHDSRLVDAGRRVRRPEPAGAGPDAPDAQPDDE